MSVTSRRTLLLAGAAQFARAADALETRAETGAIGIYDKGRLVTRFVFDVKYDKPFLYPLTTPGGTVVSRGWPIEPRPGEAADHAWHRGIFYGHGLINGQDFWRELGREKTSRMLLSGDVRHGRKGKGIYLDATFLLQPPKGEPIGSVRQQYTIERRENAWKINASITLQADKGQPLTLGDTDDGGFAYRLSDEFRQDRGAVLANSEGQQKTENIWGKPARWTHYSATVNGRPVSVAMFDHPDNFRYPTAWHARGYSLNSANPFAQKAFSRGKAADGSFTVLAGGKLAFRYTVLLNDGLLNAKEIEAAAKKL